MDNNMNQQPVYQQQAPMYQQAPKQPSNNNMLGLIALICSAVGLVMALLGVTLYCTCSASATFEAGSTGYTNSAVMVVAIIGVLIAVAGVVLAILEMKKDSGNKIACIAAAVGVFAVLYGIIPTMTICGYNCSLQSASEDMANTDAGDLDLDLDDFDFGY